MDKLKYIKLELPDGSYSESIPLAVDANYVDVNGNTLVEELNEKPTREDINLIQNTLQTEIESLASGSPKGIYATVAALVSANPDTGVYIISEDGHIYSWTKNAIEAIDLGLYQATGIADKSIETKMIQNNSITYKKIADNYLKCIEDEFKNKNLFFIDDVKITNNTINTFDITQSTIGALIGTAIAYPFIFSQAYKYLIIPKITIATDGYLTIGLFSAMSGQIQQETNMISKIKYYIESGTYFDLIIPLTDLNFISLEQDHTYYLAIYKLTNEINPTYNSLESLSIPIAGNNYNTGNFIDFNNDLKYIVNFGSWSWTTLGTSYYNKGIIQFGLSTDLPISLNFDALSPSSSQNYFTDKKIACLGDSITWGYNGATTARADSPYPTILKNLLNAQDVYNYGINGSTIGGGGSEAEIAGTSPMNIRYDNMDSSVDYVIVMGGTNDHGQSIPLGTINDTTNQTFYGALDVLINGLITKYPKKRLAFITPMQKGNYGANSVGVTFDEYCEAMLEKCKQYSMPVFDLHNACGCNSKTSIWSTWRQNNLPDNLHPNQDYYYYLAKKIANFIESL